MSTAYTEVQDAAACPIKNNASTVVVQLRVPNKGIFVIFGRVVFTNNDAAAQQLVTQLTTLNGQTELDKVRFQVDATPHAACVSLHAILNVDDAQQNDIVDIRCTSANGQAEFGVITALSVDEIG
jgi:hypothetical protein